MSALDRLGPAEVVALSRHDASLWWREHVDPAGLATPDDPLTAEELEDLTEAIGLRWSVWGPAYLWAARCAGALEAES